MSRVKESTSRSTHNAVCKTIDMAAEMNAAVLYGKEDVRIERLPVPQAGAGEIVVRVAAALTCGTDLKVFRRGYHEKMLKPPAPFGHEMAGVVSQVGAGVTKFQEGDRVVAVNSAPCGECYFCREQQENLCDDLVFNNGAYAEYFRIPARIVAKNTFLVPASLPLEHAALTEPLACVLHGMDETGAQAGDQMVVIGAGPIGLMFIHAAALNNIEVIAVVKHTGASAAGAFVRRASRCANYDDRRRNRCCSRADSAGPRRRFGRGSGGDTGDLAVGRRHGAQGWRGQFLWRLRCRNPSGAGYQPPALQRSDAAREFPSSSIRVPPRLRLDCEWRVREQQVSDRTSIAGRTGSCFPAVLESHQRH